MGRNADALTNYRDAAASSDGRSAAAGRLHEIMLRYIRPRTPTRRRTRSWAQQETISAKPEPPSPVAKAVRTPTGSIPAPSGTIVRSPGAAASLSLTQYSVIAGLDPAIHDESQRYVDCCQAGYGKYFLRVVDWPVTPGLAVKSSLFFILKLLFGCPDNKIPSCLGKCRIKGRDQAGRLVAFGLNIRVEHVRTYHIALVAQ